MEDIAGMYPSSLAFFCEQLNEERDEWCAGLVKRTISGHGDSAMAFSASLSIM